MSLACEAEVRVQNECALRFSITSKPVPVLEYIKAISSLVGATHVLAVFEESDNLKVFFDDKRYVDALIRSGIHVLGHHVRIDYVVPPGSKVILTNVDPVITNYDVMRLLSTYGAVVSPIIRPPISDDTELCHIGYGVRYVYMGLNGGIPNKIDFKYGDQTYTVKVRIEERAGMFMIPYIKTDDSEEIFDEINPNYEALPGPSGINTNSVSPIVVSVESTASESSSVQIESSKSLRSITPGKRRRPRKNLLMRRKKVTATSQAARRIKKTVKHKFISARKNKYKQNHPSRKAAAKNKLSLVDLPATPYSDNVEVAKNDEVDGEDSALDASTSGRCILEIPKFLMFIDEVKRHRAPLELAKKYIGDDCDPNALNILIEQLQDYKASQNDINLKTRVWRLIKSLKEAM